MSRIDKETALECIEIACTDGNANYRFHGDKLSSKQLLYEVKSGSNRGVSILNCIIVQATMAVMAHMGKYMSPLQASALVQDKDFLHHVDLNSYTLDRKVQDALDYVHKGALTMRDFYSEALAGHIAKSF